MLNDSLPKVEVAVKATKSPQSLEIIKNAYRNDGAAQTVSRNYHIRIEQDEMIGELATYSGETKVTVLRAIIDEWREMKLRGCP